MTEEDSNNKNNKSEPTEKSEQTYEERVKNSKFPGLLGVFEERLRNRSSEENEDEEFPTINLTSQNITNAASLTTDEKVSEEQIDGLLKKSPVKYETSFNESASKKDTRVEEIIASQPRYEDSNPTTENYAKAEDTQIGYSPNNPTISNTSLPTDSPTDLGPTPYSQREISDDEVMKHIIEHRKKKANTVESEPTSTDS